MTMETLQVVLGIWAGSSIGHVVHKNPSLIDDSLLSKRQPQPLINLGEHQSPMCVMWKLPSSSATDYPPPYSENPTNRLTIEDHETIRETTSEQMQTKHNQQHYCKRYIYRSFSCSIGSVKWFGEWRATQSRIVGATEQWYIRFRRFFGRWYSSA